MALSSPPEVVDGEKSNTGPTVASVQDPWRILDKEERGCQSLWLIPCMILS